MANEKRLVTEFRNELMSEFIRLCKGNDFGKLTLLKAGDVIERLYEKYSTIPAVDAAPVVHGRWTYYSTTMQECSNCHRHTARHKYKYCPHCGAVMEDGYHDGQ